MHFVWPVWPISVPSLSKSCNQCKLLKNGTGSIHYAFKKQFHYLIFFSTDFENTTYNDSEPLFMAFRRIRIFESYVESQSAIPKNPNSSWSVFSWSIWRDHDFEEITTFNTTLWKVSKCEVFSGPYFSVFGLNTEIFWVNLLIQWEYRNVGTRRNSVVGHFLNKQRIKLAILSSLFSGFRIIKHTIKSHFDLLMLMKK